MELRPGCRGRSWPCRWRCCSHSLQYLLQALQTASSGPPDSTTNTTMTFREQSHMASNDPRAGRGLTELEGLRLSWDSVSGGNWKSTGRVVFLLVTLRADLLFVVAACGEETGFNPACRFWSASFFLASLTAGTTIKTILLLLCENTYQSRRHR